ncbi:MAG: sodium:calcium antiporter, partial [Verrucomicrobia bacterium]|nr:sodium:calcium antiporter [Verrucomicrobiota bacterium]
GSNICNIALVLGVGAMIFPLAIQPQVVRREMPVLLGATLIFLLMIKDGVIDRLEGGVLFAGVLIYVVTSLVQARKEDPNVSEDLDPEVIKAAKNAGLARVFLDLFLIVIGALLLVLGADRMVVGGENIARFYGVPEAIIGLTLFAFGTSLPELATSVVAAMKKQGDIIVGNAVGSCIFNLLAVVGLAGIVSPLKGEGVTVIHLSVMLAVTVILMPMMLHRMKLDRWEGVLLVTGYLGFTVWLIVA